MSDLTDINIANENDLLKDTPIINPNELTRDYNAVIFSFFFQNLKTSLNILNDNKR